MAEERVSEAPGISENVGVAADASFGFCAVWKDGRDGNAEVYYRHRNAVLPGVPPRVDGVSPETAEAFGSHLVSVWGAGLGLGSDVRFVGSEGYELPLVAAGGSNDTLTVQLDLTDAPIDSWQVIARDYAGQADTLCPFGSDAHFITERAPSRRTAPGWIGDPA
jgi:hypothetical protein